ncbi:DUF2933 domain-containing protein [Ruegeria atlantica]|uniref:DUF2933 domain-containing protein n=1 Tax=Ruegeria atlantica TaxID=81569 RepID=A0AA91C0R5_9RHOB|nr:DUF2933 domain-containing protein [Ruegeria atlantica]QFT75702.1 hypothetical protein FIU92_21840 [Ruegeria sp. THAF33]
MKENQIADAPQASTPVSGGKILKWGMMVCCIAMITPIVLYFIAGGTVGGLSESLGLFAPLILCLGAHFFMHKAMGKSCHSNKSESERPKATDAAVGPNPVHRQ